MKAATGFLFFLLFLAGLALVNLKGMQANRDTRVQSAEELMDTAWRLEYLGAMALDTDSHVFFQFHANGTVRGHGGCNSFYGDYLLDNGQLKIGPLGATRMACPEPVMSYEITFLEALHSAQRADFTRTGLALFSKTLAPTTRFSRTEMAAVAN